MKRKDKTELSAVRLRWQRFWHYARPIAAWLLSIGLVAVIVIVAVRFVLSHYISAVDPDDATPYEVVIPQNASASKIADMLYHACGEGEKGLIASSASFKVYVDFVGKANNLKAGTYRLSKNMTIPEIVDVLAAGNPARRTTRLVVIEGRTVEEIAKTIRGNENITTDADAFLAGTLRRLRNIRSLRSSTIRTTAVMCWKATCSRTHTTSMPIPRRKRSWTSF